MTEDHTQSRFPNVGRLGIAILEHLAEPILGKDAQSEIKAPVVERELLSALVRALERTEEVFISEHDDDDICQIILGLPLSNLPSVVNAVRAFYSRPNDRALSKVLHEQISLLYPALSAERIESGISHYLAILRIELANLPGDIREILQAQAMLRMADTLERIERISSSEGRVFVTPGFGLIKEYPRPQEHVRFCTPNFVGRKEELAKILQFLQKDSTVGLYAFKGMGGIGKTALAAEIANRLNDNAHFPGGILWADLGSELTSEIARRWLGNYGYDVSGDDEQTRLTRLGTVLGDIPALLILDNAQDASVVRKLVYKSKGIAVLITTRKQSAIPIGVRPVALDEMAPEESLSLLTGFAGQRIQTELHEAKEICFLCGYLPLALALAGSQLANNGRWKTLSEYRQQLEKHRLEMLSKGNEREDNVRLALDVSYQELNGAQKETFDSLCLLKGADFSAESTVAMSAYGKVAEEILEQLVDLSLVMRAGNGRYRIHDLLRDYATECLSSRDAEIVNSWQKRLVSFYQNYTQVYASQLEILDIERQNILGVTEFPRQHTDRDWDSALVGIVRNLTDYLKIRGLWKEAAYLGELAYDLAFENGFLEAQAYFATWTLSWVYFHQGNIPNAERWARRGLELYERIGSVKDRAAAARRLGMAVMSSGQFEPARVYLQEALDAFRKINLSSKIGDTLTVLGYLERKCSNLGLAEAYLDEALKIVESVKDKKEISMVLYEKGRLAATRALLEDAKQLHKNSLEIDRELQRKPGITWNLFRLGLLDKSLGNNAEAKEELQLAMRLFDEMGVPERVHQIAQALHELE